MMGEHTNHIQCVALGRTDYGVCWGLQRELFEGRLRGVVPDTLLLTEHDHTYTIGKSGSEDHLLASDHELRARGVSVYHNDRGGDITYHGPGQLVGYPILDLTNYYQDLHRYLRDLEEVILRTLHEYGVEGHRESEYTGVWVGRNKICAIGVKTNRWVTMHGFAFNVSTDPWFYQRIIPCGIFERGVTSLSEVLGRPVGLDPVARSVTNHFGAVFGAVMEEMPAVQTVGRQSVETNEE